MFIGYSPHQKGYKCYVPETRRVLVSRDVRFVEARGYYDKKSWDELKDLSQSTSDRANSLRRVMEGLGIYVPQERVANEPNGYGDPAPPNAPNAEMGEQSEDDVVTVPPQPHLDPEGGNQSQPTEEVEQEGLESHDQDEHQPMDSNAPNKVENVVVNEDQPMDSNDTTLIEQPGQGQTLRRSTRIKQPASNWINTRVYFNAQAVFHPIQAVCSLAQYPQEHQAFIGALDQEYIPSSYEEAMKHEEWRESVGDETNAMIINDTWYEAELPKGKKAVTSRWVFTIKYLANGKVERYKTRLVARGFTQTYGENYLETFAPVAKLHTIRIVLSLAVNLEWDLWQMDVKNAFLQGELEDEVYMRPPPGLEHLVKPGNVLRLKKAIYGLKQSPRAWYHKLRTTLNGRGFIKSEADHTLFTLTSKQGIVVILIREEEEKEKEADVIKKRSNISMTKVLIKEEERSVKVEVYEDKAKDLHIKEELRAEEAKLMIKSSLGQVFTHCVCSPSLG